MKNPDSFGKAILLLSILLGTSGNCLAIAYTITTDTSALIGNPSGPFSLDFQFIDGEGVGDGNNTATLSNFNFSGGGWNGLDPGTISLTDTSFFSEFFQEFTPGLKLSFSLNLTTLADAGGTPDSFSFAILDSSFFEIPTKGLGNALLNIDITSPNLDIAAFGSDPTATSIDIPAPGIELQSTAVPESLSTFRALAGSLFILWIAPKRKQK
jgi:hypothetical protein